MYRGHDRRCRRLTRTFSLSGFLHARRYFRAESVDNCDNSGERCKLYIARIFATRCGCDERPGNGRDVSKNCGQRRENSVDEMYFSSPPPLSLLLFSPCEKKAGRNKRNSGSALTWRADLVKYSARLIFNKKLCNIGNALNQSSCVYNCSARDRLLVPEV